METLRLPAGEVVLLATVQGMVAERETVRKAYALTRPKAVALAVSPDAAESLSRFERTPDMDDPFEELPDHDYVYSVVLRDFGDVDLPPPDLLEAARLAKTDGLPLRGVDMTDDAYEDHFTKMVSVWGFLRYGRIQRKLAKRPPKAPDAPSFALAWDAAIRRVKGIAKLEALREAHIAHDTSALAREVGGRVLLVVDVARAAGVRQALLAPPAVQATAPPQR